jgi:hypothetical protein
MHASIRIPRIGVLLALRGNSRNTACSFQSSAIWQKLMTMITTGDGIDIFYKDWGSGQPIVFSHGWPLSADDWDTQMLFFLAHDYRVTAADRRGHGRSSQPARVMTWTITPMT